MDFIDHNEARDFANKMLDNARERYYAEFPIEMSEPPGFLTIPPMCLPSVFPTVDDEWPDIIGD